MGKLEGVVTHAAVDPQTDAVLVEATGNATQLGQFAVSIPHFVNTPTRTAAGTCKFTAPNGDELTAQFTGHASPTPTLGVILIVETATITGCTGRFAGATGSFVTERLFDRIAEQRRDMRSRCGATSSNAAPATARDYARDAEPMASAQQ